ncbi:unnamed protein product, partial [Polarella glacialis]
EGLSFVEVDPLDYAVISTSPSSSSRALLAAGQGLGVVVRSAGSGLNAVVPSSLGNAGDPPWAALRVSSASQLALAGLCEALAAAGVQAILHAPGPSAAALLCLRSDLAAAAQALVAAGCAVRGLQLAD